MDEPRDEHDRHDAENAPMRHFSQSLPMLLLRAREAVMRHFRSSLRRFDLTEQQWRVLRALSTLEETEVSELARATFLLAPSLSRIVRDLEQRELILRRSDANDLRRGLVRISPRARALIAEVSPESEQIYDEISRRFTPQKLGLLQDLLRDLEASMANAVDDDPQEEDPVRSPRRPSRQ